MLKQVLHTGVRVDDLEKAVELYKRLGFSIRNQFDKPEPKAKVATVEKGEAAYELWQFEDAEHPQVKFIQNHIAIYSDDLQSDLKELEKQGFTIVIPVTDGVVLRYAFVQDPSGCTYEIATKKIY